MKNHGTLLAIVLFCLTMSLSLQAQNKTPGQLTGTIVDSDSGTPLDFATITIYTIADSALVGGGVTDEKGQFSIALPTGQFLAKLEFIAYQPKTIDGIEINPDQLKVNLGTVSLTASAEMLDEVEVTAERSTMELSLDKKVFNVGKDLGNAGGSAMEILSNIPSVTVDGEGTVKLRGNANVRLLIDGKPSGLVSFDGGSGLQQLQASLVERVEIITNPSARYEAEGVVGIINIVLKKDRKQGFNGSFEVTAGHPTNLGAAANMNYRHKKINFFLNYGIAYRIRPSVRDTYLEVYANDTTFLSQHTYDGEHIGFHNNIRGGLDYYFSEKDILTASYLYSRSAGDRLTDLRYEDYVFSLDNPTGYTLRTQDEDEVEPVSEYMLTYKKLFEKKGHELNAFVRYLDHWEDSDQIFTQYTFLPDGTPEPSKSIVQNSPNDETERQLLAQIDYVQPFGKEGKLETGFRSSFRDMSNDYLVEQEDEEGNFIPLEGLDNNFLYDENIHAVFGIIGSKWGRFSYQLGLRAEWTDIETELEETGETNPRKYSNLFPSAHLTFDLPKEHAIQASYSRRVRRPVYNELSPFVTYSDSRNFFSGNPDLNPEFSDVIEVGHIKYFEKVSLSSIIYYRHTEGKIERIRLVDAKGFSNTQPQNLDHEDAYGLELVGSYNPSQKWKTDLSFNFFRAIIDGTNVDNSYMADTYSWFAQKTSRFSLSKTINVQLRGTYEAPVKTAQGKQKSVYYIDLAVNKELFQGNGTLTLNVSDVFNSRRSRFIARGDTFFTEINGQWTRRQINLTLSYRINQ